MLSPGAFLATGIDSGTGDRQKCQGVSSPGSRHQLDRRTVSRLKNNGISLGETTPEFIFFSDASNRAEPQALSTLAHNLLTNTFGFLRFLSHFFTLLPVPSRITSKINLLHTNLCFRVFLLEPHLRYPGYILAIRWQ